MFFGKILYSYSASLHQGVYSVNRSVATGGFNAGVVSHQEGIRNTPSRFMLQKLEISSSLMGHMVRIQTLLRTAGGFCCKL